MTEDIRENQDDSPSESSPAEEPKRRSRRRGRRGKSRGATASPPEGTETQVDAAIDERPAFDHAPKRAEPPRQRRSGFHDSLDRQVCVARMSLYPEVWPVAPRSGLAVQPLVEIARIGDAVLLCDLSHAGPCVWPEYLGFEPSPGFDDEENVRATPEQSDEPEAAV